MIRKRLFFIFLIVATAAPLAAQWSTISLDQPYRYWHRDPDGTLFDDVLNLSPGAFNNQVIANPHVQYNDNGEWLIMGYGDASLGDTRVGDAVYVFKRYNTGWYKVPSTAALAWPAAQPGTNWLSVGGIGSGAGFTKTLTPSSGGYKYFAAVQVAQAPVNANGAFTYGWTSWAVSADGESWSFVSQSGGLTNDPGQSLKLIRRSDSSDLTHDGGTRFWHIAMVYNKYDNYFYIASGWAGLCGIKATWWRIRFDSTNGYGLPYNASLSTYEVQVLSNGNYTNTVSVGNGSISNGLITDDWDVWQCDAQSPTAANGAGPADPMDIVQLYKSDGSFDSMLFLYQPELDLSKIYYVKGTLPTTATGTFVWATPQYLDLSALTNLPDGTKYDPGCGAGGFSMCVNQNGWQANGAPNLFGFLATYRKDLYSQTNSCSAQPEGIVPLHLNLN
jgi:hypothetical protein